MYGILVSRHCRRPMAATLGCQMQNQQRGYNTRFPPRIPRWNYKPGLASFGRAMVAVGSIVTAAFGSYRYLTPAPEGKSEEQRIREFYQQAGTYGSSDFVKSSIENFAKDNIANGTPIAFVTSGGTKVPLEANTVRFVDNFSTGTRGALCAEEGYAVIFLHRRGSQRPFLRQLQSWMKELPLHIHFNGGTANAINIGPHQKDAIEDYKKHKAEGRFLELEFESVTEYLQLLQIGGTTLGQFEGKVFYLLAAAVSDFYVPPSDLTEHKIQSGGGSSKLTLQLSPVPKVLLCLKSNWAPQGFLVSFKLETDPDLLLNKARKAKAAYSPDVVVANLLPKRYDEVHLVTSSQDDGSVETIRREKMGSSIENTFIQRLIELHKLHLTKTNEKE